MLPAPDSPLGARYCLLQTRSRVLTIQTRSLSQGASGPTSSDHNEVLPATWPLGVRCCLPRAVAHSCWGSGPPLGAFARDLEARGMGSGGSGLPVTFAAPSGVDFYRFQVGMDRMVEEFSFGLAHAEPL